MHTRTVLGLVLFFVGLVFLLWPDPLRFLPPWTNLAAADARFALPLVGGALAIFAFRVPGSAREAYLTSALVLLTFGGVSWFPPASPAANAGTIFWTWGTAAVGVALFFAFARTGHRPAVVWGGALLLPAVFSFLGVRAFAYAVLLAGLSLLLERAPARRSRR
ncbi:MAG: hypothetical protein IMX03_04365 [Brockia lithotrophica]|nr:hypothetical protein [Brockia lithotrophica]